MTRLLTFDTTHHALWAEELLLGGGLAAAVVPVPPGTGALCDLAIEFLPPEEDAVLALLREAGVQFRVWAA